MKNKSTALLLELLAWYGTIAILLGYFLLSLGFWDARNLYYHLFIGSGAFTIILTSYHKKDYQPVVINTIFCLIALFSIIRLLLKP